MIEVVATCDWCQCCLRTEIKPEGKEALVKALLPKDWHYGQHRMQERGALVAPDLCADCSVDASRVLDAAEDALQEMIQEARKRARQF